MFSVLLSTVKLSWNLAVELNKVLICIYNWFGFKTLHQVLFLSCSESTGFDLDTGWITPQLLWHVFEKDGAVCHRSQKEEAVATRPSTTFHWTQRTTGKSREGRKHQINQRQKTGYLKDSHSTIMLKHSITKKLWSIGILWSNQFIFLLCYFLSPTNRKQSNSWHGFLFLCICQTIQSWSRKSTSYSLCWKQRGEQWNY